VREHSRAGVVTILLTATVVWLGTVGARAGLSFEAVSVEVDMPANHVIEPGEFPGVAPSWKNISGGTVALTGTASNISGPPGATYGFLDTTADYGSVANGATASCWTTTGHCYVLSISNPPTRPTFHWDISFLETLSTGQMRTWTLHVGRTFNDVSPTSSLYPFVETLVHNAITAGCNFMPGWYCATFSVTREQMAIFLLRSIEGGSYVPPSVPSTFADVPASSPYSRWIEELANRGITAGCGTNPARYCPTEPVLREQMAVFVLRGIEGGSYVPPQPSGQRYIDVPPSHPFYAFIDQMGYRGITGGCAASPPKFCPTAPVTRIQMAAFLVRGFDLELYGL